MIESIHNRLVSRRHWLLILLTLIFLTGQWLAAIQPVSAAMPAKSGMVMDMASCGASCEHDAADEGYCESICTLSMNCSPQIGGNAVTLLLSAGIVQMDYQENYQFQFAEPIYHPPRQVHA
ncbi:hypothetical protein [Aliamphritea ceti]|uniref:hypothetical protein n=1 Tax=Aliamphritea ceti TaxID=1524258 RepID=UPI0021C3C0D6|nr:hypothetical protein [Aliamphritea ceti]